MVHNKITVIIKNCHDISAIAALLKQNSNSWECFIVDNTIKDIEKHINIDNRFSFVNGKDAIDRAIANANGEYILFINSNDILVANAIDNILNMIYMTNADVVNFKSVLLSDAGIEESDTKCRFKYICNHDEMMQYVFNNICEFCFKKNLVHEMPNFEHTFLTGALVDAKDMVATKSNLLISQGSQYISVKDICNNYKSNHEKLPEKFWRKYFKTKISKIIASTVNANDKNLFLEFCRTVPLRLIPLRYRIFCYILKKTNK